MVYLDLFAGIGGFPKGFANAGISFEEHYFSEIDKHAIAVYKHNFKDARFVGDVRGITKKTLSKRPNIITFGFPCQDLSIAGQRRGLDGQRSSLFFEAIRIVKEFTPEVFVFENVKGLLSNNKGKDFETVLRTIANIGFYECEWQLLNTSWVLPQNRERVFFVGHLRGRSKPGVFPFRKSDSEFDQNREDNEGQKNIAWALRARDYKDFTNVVLARPAITPDRHNKRQNGRRFKEDGEPSFTLTAQDRHGVMVSAISMERTDKGKELRKAYESGIIKHGFNEYRKPIPRKDGLANTLDTQEKSRLIFQGYQIRRFTEIECERLQGFPDNWTKYGNYDGTVKKISKRQRYKQLGNAVTTMMPEIIANRLPFFK